LRPGTPLTPHHRDHFDSPKKLAENFREEQALRVFGIRTQSLAASSRRSTRELHHPGKKLSRQISLDRNDLGGDCFRLAQTSKARDYPALTSIRHGLYRFVSFFALHAQ